MQYFVVFLYCHLTFILYMDLLMMQNKIIMDYHGLQICGIIMCLIIGIGFLYYVIKTLRIVLSYKKAINHSENVEGTIINFCERTSSRGPNSYHLIIKYNDINTGEEKILITPKLKFYPYKALASYKCNIYYYNNMIIAGNFKFHSDSNPNQVFIPRDQTYLKIIDPFYKVLLLLALIDSIALLFLSIFSIQF